jgi:hypothetical protein
MSENQNRKIRNGTQKSDWLPIVLEKVGALHHGAVGIIVHDSGVAQVVVKEKTLLPSESAADKPAQTNAPPS